MRKFVALLLSLTAAAAALAAPALADSITVSIADTYKGGIVSTKTSGGYTPVSSGNTWYQADRVGTDTKYEVYGMAVTYNFSANTLSVAVESSYFDNVGSDGTSMGDLFISSHGWNMTGLTGPGYNDDTAQLGEDWEYVLVMDNHGGTTSGTVQLYKIAGGSHAATNGVVNLSDVPGLIGATFRADQEVTFSANSGVVSLASGTWSITNNAGDHDFLTFNIGLSGAGWSLLDAGSPGLGFHWAMSCANDTIEGLAPVPEPASILLFGAALLGYGKVARRRRRAIADAS